MLFQQYYFFSIFLYFLAQGLYFLIKKRTYRFEHQTTLVLLPYACASILQLIQRQLC